MIEPIIIFIVSLSTTIAYIVAEYSALHLPAKSKFFDRKPFNCRPCSTFHLLWLTVAVYALVFRSFELFVMGLIYAFVVFFIVYYIDKRKIIK